MSLVGKIKTLFSDKEKTEPMFPRTKVKAVSDDEGVGLNVILENMVYSSEMVDGTSTVPVNADTLGGRPADEYALGVEVDAQVDELRTELQADIDGLTYADVGAAPQATVTSVLSAKGWYRVGMVAARYNDNAGFAAFRITVGSVYNNFINSTSIVEGVSSYDNGQLSTLFSWGGGYPITSVRLCQVSESQKASVYIDVYYNQSNTNNCFVTVDTTTGTFTPNSALTAVTTSETVVCETTLSGRYPFTTAHTIPITNGGTGATTAAGALTNLGITATAAELNKMDGVTATTTELNYVDGVTSNIQTQLNNKAKSSHDHNSLGGSNTVTGEGAVALGRGNAINSQLNYALGASNTIGSVANYSFAFGYNNTVTLPWSFAMGNCLINKRTNACYIGQYNNDSSSGDFVIGNGKSTSAKSNCFRVASSSVYGGTYNSSGADYAEYFEWADGNPDGEDRIGRFVTISEADKITIAAPVDDILGVISGNGSVIGDAHDDQWHGMYMHDIYGRPIFEDVEIEIEVPDGDIKTVVESRLKLNPEYDNTKEYIPRSQRKEWDAVGMMGKLILIDDGSCVVGGRCACGEGGIAVASETGYRVLTRLDENHVKVLIK